MNDLLKILDFIDTKLLEIRKSGNLTWGQRITAYNLLIDLSEFIRERMDEEVKHERTGVRNSSAPYI